MLFANKKMSSPLCVAMLSESSTTPVRLVVWDAIEPGSDRNDLTALSGFETDESGEEGADVLAKFDVDDLRGILGLLLALSILSEGADAFLTCCAKSVD